jgi:DNA polymerase elongation subunit (family B)
MTSKILVLDIETRPALAYVWRLYDENIGLEQLLEPSEMISFSAKWHGKPKMFYKAVRYSKGYEINGYDRPEMLELMSRLWGEADALVTFNGDKFDLPKLRGEFVKHGLRPPPPVASIDVRKTTSAMGFTSGKLAHVAPLLGVGEKQDTNGFVLWRDYLEGKPKARRDMKEYNLKDVLLLEGVYDKVKSYITTHPYIGSKAEQCPVCESTKVQSRGVRRTRTFWITRIHCQDCGAWSNGPKRKVGS